MNVIRRQGPCSSSVSMILTACRSSGLTGDATGDAIGDATGEAVIRVAARTAKKHFMMNGCQLVFGRAGG
jgi:hypothetical protein